MTHGFWAVTYLFGFFFFICVTCLNWGSEASVIISSASWSSLMNHKRDKGFWNIFSLKLFEQQKFMWAFCLMTSQLLISPAILRRGRTCASRLSFWNDRKEISSSFPSLKFLIMKDQKMHCDLWVRKYNCILYEHFLWIVISPQLLISRMVESC